MGLLSCQETQEPGEVIIYSNDFSQEDLGNISNGRILSFNNSAVLGNYNNEEVSLFIDDIPSHNLIKVSIDLLIHDSWDGNAGPLSGRDIWYLNLDGKSVVNTTFSNQPCVPTFCPSQSFPEQYGRHFDPKTGAMEEDLPGLCKYADSVGWTTKYRISKLIRHKGNQMTLVCGDRTVQNVLTTSQICDESWSLSKIEVSTVE